MPAYRLFVELVKKDLKTKYKNSFLGIFWIVLQPVLLAVMFLFVRDQFTYRLDPVDLNFLDMYALLILWQFFSSSLVRSVNSFPLNYGLVTRIKFPKILLPLSVIFSCFQEALVNIAVYFLFMLIFGSVKLPNLFFLFFVLLISGIFITALCILVSLLQCFLPDLKLIIPFLTRLSILAVPVFYDEHVISPVLSSIYKYFPLGWMISATKQFLSNSSFVDETALSVSVIGIILFVIIFFLFKRCEHLVVDHI